MIVDDFNDCRPSSIDGIDAIDPLRIKGFIPLSFVQLPYQQKHTRAILIVSLFMDDIGQPFTTLIEKTPQPFPHYKRPLLIIYSK